MALVLIWKEDRQDEAPSRDKTVNGGSSYPFSAFSEVVLMTAQKPANKKATAKTVVLNCLILEFGSLELLSSQTANYKTYCCNSKGFLSAE